MVRLRSKKGPDKNVINNAKISSSPEREKFQLTEGLAVEILSWLPVKYVLRCKCVCKLWQSITQDPSFIEKHQRRSKCQVIYEDISNLNGNREIFRWLYYVNGLGVEISRMTGKYRIRNPATKQVVEVLDTGQQNGWMKMAFDSSTKDYKLIYVHRKEGTLDVGVKLLTVGTDVAWRLLDFSFSDIRTRGKLFVRMSPKVCYIVSFRKAKSEKTMMITGLIVEDESFVKIKNPSNFQSGRGHFRTFIWGRKLSVGFITKKELRVWVLENYKKQIWSEKKIIPLTFMKNRPERSKNLGICCAPEGRLIFSLNSDRLQYDIESKKVHVFQTPPGMRRLSGIVPCLVSLRGMHPEEINVSKTHIDQVRGRWASLYSRFNNGCRKVIHSLCHS